MDRKAVKAILGVVAGVSFVIPSGFAANDVSAELAERLKAQGLIEKIYADKIGGKPLPPGNESPDTELRGKFISQGMEFTLPDEIPTKPVVIFQTALENCNDRDSRQYAAISETSTDTDSWTNTETWGVGIEAAFTLKLPLVGETETTVKADYSSSNAETVSQSTSVSWNAGYDVSVGPRKKVTVQFVVAQEELDIPYKVDFIAAGDTALTILEPGKNAARLRWVKASRGSVPKNAIIAGSESGRRLPVCRASYRNGQHPGKVVAGNCNFGYGGKEILARDYEVLVKDAGRITWKSARNGSRPPGAFKAGREPGRDLYLCRARYKDGTHPGKIVAKNCNFGWGGNEILKSSYQVLVPQASTATEDMPLHFQIEDYLSLKDRMFTVRGMYRGAKAVQGHVRVGPPQPLETCGPLVTASSRQPSVRGSNRSVMQARATSKQDLSSARPLPAEYTVVSLVRDGTRRVVSTAPRLVSLRQPYLRGADVAALQGALNESGASLVVDGVFGPESEAAVRRFQGANDLDVDGIVGNRTRRSLGDG